MTCSPCRLRSALFRPCNWTTICWTSLALRSGWRRSSDGPLRHTCQGLHQWCLDEVRCGAAHDIGVRRTDRTTTRRHVAVVSQDRDLYDRRVNPVLGAMTHLVRVLSSLILSEGAPALLIFTKDRRTTSFHLVSNRGYRIRRQGHQGISLGETTSGS